jgi:lauroyl/myristoyl acyltransferase
MRRLDNSYQILSSEPLEMVECGDRDEELLENAEAACRIAESYIRLAPEQWSMSFPVWPEALEEVAG